MFPVLISYEPVSGKSLQECFTFPGPRLFAAPGDVLEVVFRNDLNTSTNIVPSGATTNSTTAAEPGQTQYYEWKIGQDVRSQPHSTWP